MIVEAKRLHCLLALIVGALGCVGGCDVGSDATDGGVGDAGGTGGSPCDGVTCDDGNPCTLDRCIPGIGCVFPVRTGPCEDGSACTVGDACVAGVCTPGASLDCDD